MIDEFCRLFLGAIKHQIRDGQRCFDYSKERTERVALCLGNGAKNKFYDILNFLAEHVITERHARVLPWRGIGAAYTSFAAEGFLDEVAEKSGKTPFELRKHLLRNNKCSGALLDELKKMSDAVPLQAGRARGLAFTGYGDTPAAGTVEISLDRKSGEMDVYHAWIAIDAGIIIFPGNSCNLIGDGVLRGISAALFEKVTIQNGVFDQDWYRTGIGLV